MWNKLVPAKKRWGRQQWNERVPQESEAVAASQSRMFIVDQKCPSFHQSESSDGSESEFPFGVVEETPSSTQDSFNLDYNSTIAPNKAFEKMVMNLCFICGVCMSIMYASPKSVCIKDLGYKRKYWEIIGSLMYFFQWTRPDSTPRPPDEQAQVCENVNIFWLTNPTRHEYTGQIW